MHTRMQNHSNHAHGSCCQSLGERDMLTKKIAVALCKVAVALCCGSSTGTQHASWKVLSRAAGTSDQEANTLLQSMLIIP
jgi:hypothetical protein